MAYPDQPFHKQIPTDMYYNVWLLSINDKDPCTVSSCQQEIKKFQKDNATNDIEISLCKRKDLNKTVYASIRSMFKQIRYKITNKVEPTVNSLVQLPNRPTTPFHVGELIDNPIKSDCLQALLKNY